MTNQTGVLPSKPHYEILDGLRGVAAIMVVAFHLFEAHQLSRSDNMISHGYLAVDFFFILSGFVIGYAYDDRWGKMSIGNFFKRRIIRLQPMLILGTIIGAICFYFGEGDMFPLIAHTPVWMLLLVAFLGCLLLPIPPVMDIRVWTEMFPLNGPAWSLFFEYIAYILYGLFVHKFSKLLLTILVTVSGLALIRFLVFGTYGDALGGHIFDLENFTIGMTRLMYPFFCGLLLLRMGKLIKVKGGFWWCSLILIAVFVTPRLGGNEQVWMNGLYEAAAIIVLFPVVVLMGAGSSIKGKNSLRICDFLGKISYPMYIIHYPFIYLYMAYVSETGFSWQDTWPIMLTIWLGCIVLAYVCLRLYDEPVRNWLQKKFVR